MEGFLCLVLRAVVPRGLLLPVERLQNNAITSQLNAIQSGPQKHLRCADRCFSLVMVSVESVSGQRLAGVNH